MEGQLLNPEEAETAQNYLLIADLFYVSDANQPVSRWLEYQAYVGFMKYVVERGALPADFELYTPDFESVRKWISGGKMASLPKQLKDELRRLLTKLKAAGSGIVDDLCRFYCDYKHKLVVGTDAINLTLTVAQVQAILVAYKYDFLFVGGVPVTAFAALLIHAGLLDEICDCSLYQAIP